MAPRSAPRSSKLVHLQKGNSFLIYLEFYLFRNSYLKWKGSNRSNLLCKKVPWGYSETFLGHNNILKERHQSTDRHAHNRHRTPHLTPHGRCTTLTSSGAPRLELHTMSQIIPLSSKFKALAPTINGLDLQKFPLLLKRVLTTLSKPKPPPSSAEASTAGAGNQSFFTPDEAGKLTPILGVTLGELSEALRALSYVYEQAAFLNLKPEDLASQMLAAGVASAHAEVLGATWKAEAPAVMKGLYEQVGMGGPAKLANVEWGLSISMQGSSLSKTKESLARFDLFLETVGAGHGGGEGMLEEVLSVEFTHRELYSFFEKLEVVQEQLDALG